MVKEFLLKIWSVTGGPSSKFIHGSSKGKATFEFRKKATHKEIVFRCKVPFRHRLAYLFGYPFVAIGECEYEGEHYKFRFDFEVEKINVDKKTN